MESNVSSGETGEGSPSAEAIFRMEETEALEQFEAITAERRAALDAIWNVGGTIAEAQEYAEAWEEYFEREAAGLSPAAANKLWHQMMTDAYEPPHSPEVMAAPVQPVGELENRYVEWRRDFNQRLRIERLSEKAAAEGRENRELKGELHVNRQTIMDMAGGPIDFWARMRARMEEADFCLFLALIAPDDQIAGKPLSFKKIGQLLGGITKQAVSARVTGFRANHAEAWAFVEGVRWRRMTVAFSAQSPSQRRKEGVEENYGHDPVG